MLKNIDTGLMSFHFEESTGQQKPVPLHILHSEWCCNCDCFYYYHMNISANIDVSPIELLLKVT